MEDYLNTDGWSGMSTVMRLEATPTMQQLCNGHSNVSAEC